MKDRTIILALYYSLYGNVFALMKEAAAAAAEVPGTEVRLRRVPELIPEAVIRENEAMSKARARQADVPLAGLDELAGCDGLLLGAPTRFGNMCSQMRNFLDQTGGLWQKGALAGKPAGLLTSTNTMHGGQETTLVSMAFTLLHHGMVIVGVPYTVPELSTTRGGGTPYGASRLAGEAGSPPSPEETAIARALGKRLAEIAVRLKG
ncbi:MAG TPA: NAD(P)H:quinone oxidoreductase [bacterium]|uniref:p-benzoquinone reductase n=1 Tax=candidate division TA06 bacterium ADurb.Bin417 TaxID=1852828 RepID=A0A1V5M8E0_UNCT6|nr:MAG: p-benzoquinone reductase [candidate division TA06 bacterium ADurb.Bin417]HNQ35075.1 NAD(P)H:quinone oxidoreductase [bacterium]HNS48397.1 NAD(P)H:quinone oxidoreductase [bacterium]